MTCNPFCPHQASCEGKLLWCKKHELAEEEQVLELTTKDELWPNMACFIVAHDDDEEELQSEEEFKETYSHLNNTHH